MIQLKPIRYGNGVIIKLNKFPEKCEDTSPKCQQWGVAQCTTSSAVARRCPAMCGVCGTWHFFFFFTRLGENMKRMFLVFCCCCFFQFYVCFVHKWRFPWIVWSSNINVYNIYSNREAELCEAIKKKIYTERLGPFWKNYDIVLSLICHNGFSCFLISINILNSIDVKCTI